MRRGLKLRSLASAPLLRFRLVASDFERSRVTAQSGAQCTSIRVCSRAAISTF